MAVEQIYMIKLELLSSTGHTEKVCIFCEAGPRQGQAEQLSKSRKKFLATTYKPFSRSLYTGFGKRMTHRKWIRGQQWLHWLVLPSAALFSISNREFSCRTRYLKSQASFGAAEPP